MPESQTDGGDRSRAETADTTAGAGKKAKSKPRTDKDGREKREEERREKSDAVATKKEAKDSAPADQKPVDKPVESGGAGTDQPAGQKRNGHNAGGEEATRQPQPAEKPAKPEARLLPWEPITPPAELPQADRPAPKAEKSEKSAPKPDDSAPKSDSAPVNKPTDAPPASE